MITFLVVVLLSAAFVGLVRRRGTADATLLTALAGLLRRRGVFARQDLISDLAIIDIARIAVGVLATMRYGEILVGGWMVGNTTTLALTGATVLIAVCVLIGFMAPVAIFLLMASANILVDNMLGASTLGSMVMSMVLLLLLLAPAGRRISVDSLLVTGDGALSRIVAWLWRITGTPDPDRLLVAKAAALFAYFCVCLYSVSWHLNDEAWQSGMVIAWVMLSPASNPALHEQAWDLYQSSPWLFVNLSRVSIYGMYVWYVLVLPGLFMGRLVRSFVIGWGLAFFLISTFVLPLQFLGWYELVFWFVLFFPARWLIGREAVSIAVLFDDRCNLCDRTVRTIAWLDIFGQVEFRPIRRNLAFAEQHGVTLDQGLIDLVGIDLRNSRHFIGYALYETLSRRLPLLWPVFIPLMLGRWFRVGMWCYRFVADRRIRLFGVCTASAIPDRFVGARQALTPSIFGSRPVQVWTTALSSVFLALAVLSAAFLARLPLGSTDGDLGPVGRFSRTIVGAAPLGFGIGKINVFNEADLSAFHTHLSRYFVEEDRQFLSLDAEKRLEFYKNDKGIYKFTANFRAMSRTNIGCEPSYISKMAGLYQDFVQFSEEGDEKDYMVVSLILNSWPSYDDFLKYEPIEPASFVLCRATFDLTAGSLVALEFDQEGVDEALHRAKLPRIFSASGMPLSLSYPCRADAGWINTLVQSQQPFASNRELVAAALELLPERYGEFQLACAARAYAVIKREPRLADPNALRGNAASCGAGLALLHELEAATSGSEEIHEDIKVGLARAEAAQARGDVRGCVRAAALGRARFSQAILSTTAAQAVMPPPSIVPPEAGPLAIAYPCLADAGWINTLVESQQPFASDRGLMTAALDLLTDQSLGGSWSALGGSIRSSSANRAWLTPMHFPVAMRAALQGCSYYGNCEKQHRLQPLCKRLSIRISPWPWPHVPTVLRGPVPAMQQPDAPSFCKPWWPERQLRRERIRGRCRGRRHRPDPRNEMGQASVSLEAGAIRSDRQAG